MLLTPSLFRPHKHGQTAATIAAADAVPPRAVLLPPPSCSTCRLILPRGSVAASVATYLAYLSSLAGRPTSRHCEGFPNLSPLTIDPYLVHCHNHFASSAFALISKTSCTTKRLGISLPSKMFSLTGPTELAFMLLRLTYFCRYMP